METVLQVLFSEWSNHLELQLLGKLISQLKEHLFTKILIADQSFQSFYKAKYLES